MIILSKIEAKEKNIYGGDDIMTMKKSIFILLCLILLFLAGCSKAPTCKEMCEERGFQDAKCVERSIFAYPEDLIDEEKRAFNSTEDCNFPAWTPLTETEKNKDSMENIGWKYIRPSDDCGKVGPVDVFPGGTVGLCCCS